MSPCPEDWVQPSSSFFLGVGGVFSWGGDFDSNICTRSTTGVAPMRDWRSVPGPICSALRDSLFRVRASFTRWGLGLMGGGWLAMWWKSCRMSTSTMLETLLTTMLISSLCPEVSPSPAPSSSTQRRGGLGGGLRLAKWASSAVLPFWVWPESCFFCFMFFTKSICFCWSMKISSRAGCWSIAGLFLARQKSFTMDTERGGSVGEGDLDRGGEGLGGGSSG